MKDAASGVFAPNWTEDFRSRTGRRPKVLHVSNVANNAYLNARILTEVGIENHVIANDLYHFGSCPEWFDSGGVKLDRRLIGEDFFPDFWRAGVPNSARPRWFAQAPQLLSLEYLCLYCDDNPLHELAWAAMQYERFKTTICKDTMPERLWLDADTYQAAANASRLDAATRTMFEEVRSYQPILERLFLAFGEIYGPNVRSLLSIPIPFGYADPFEALVVDKEIFAIWRDLRGKGILSALGYEMAELRDWKRPPVPKGVRQADADAFVGAQGYWERLYDRYDYVINYATSPYLGLINRRKFLAYEHGTIRSIPFDEDIIGRLTHAGYQYADGVFITNIDYITAEKRVALDRKKIHYIPHAFDETPLLDFKRDHAHLQPPTDCVTFFWPTRQDWISRDIRMAKQNDIAIHALALAAKQTDRAFRIVAVDWGVDAQESKDLAAKLGIADRFEWIGPVSKLELWRRYMTSHALVDHFIGESVNGTQCEAMMLGRPMICSDCIVCGTEAYGAPPPYLAGTTAEQVAQQFLKVINDPTDKAGHGQAGFDWMIKHHSKAVITDILVKAMVTAPNGINSPDFSETVQHVTKTIAVATTARFAALASSLKNNIKYRAIAARWHANNAVAVSGWHIRNTGAQAQWRAKNVAWHVKNQAHVAGWNVRNASAQAKGHVNLASWHVKNQAHVAGWNVRNASTQAKGHVDLAAWHVKNQASVANWHAQGMTAQAKNHIDLASWHVKNQAHVAGWNVRNASTQAINQIELVKSNAKNQASVVTAHVQNLSSETKGQFTIASQALFESAAPQHDFSVGNADKNNELHGSRSGDGTSFYPLNIGDTDGSVGDQVPSYYFDVETPPQPEGEEGEVVNISWADIFKIVFSFGFLAYLSQALFRKVMRKIGVFPKGTVLWFGAEAEALASLRAFSPADEDLRQALAAGKSAILHLFGELSDSGFDVKGRLGALLPGNAYVVYWHSLSATWYAIGPNGDMQDEAGQYVIAAARALGPSGPINATINVWGVVFRFGPDGSVRHNGDLVGWLGASGEIGNETENLIEDKI
jgi:glycosyltransferase involved in cell wall biosynthesis